MWDRQSAFLEWLVQICDKTTIPIPAASFDSQQPAVMLVHILRAWYNHVMHRGRGPYNIIMSISRFLLYSSCQKQKIRVTAFIILPQLTAKKRKMKIHFMRKSKYFVRPKGRIHEKKVAVLLDFVQITSPQLWKRQQLFLNAKNVDLSDIQNDSLSKILLK